MNFEGDRMDDLISRQAAIEAICKEGTRLERNGTVAKGRMEDKTVKSSALVADKNI